MTTTSIDFYNALVKTGLDSDEAKRLADNIVTRDDITKVKSDIASAAASREDLEKMKGEIYRALLVQTGAIAGLITAINALFLFFQ